jgi:hypothetical protein
MYVMGPCVLCKRVFGFNPDKVPSFKVNGRREPCCEECLNEANELRKANGLEPFPPALPGAYEAQETPW